MARWNIGETAGILMSYWARELEAATLAAELAEARAAASRRRAADAHTRLRALQERYGLQSMHAVAGVDNGRFPVGTVVREDGEPVELPDPPAAPQPDAFEAAAGLAAGGFVPKPR